LAFWEHPGVSCESCDMPSMLPQHFGSILPYFLF